jgi:cupin fold WbuC family metalloprotein
MSVVDLSSMMLDDLVTKAGDSARKRQHCNVHSSHDDPVQRLFNAIELDSYIRPHRHSVDPKTETLLGIRGTLTFVTFDNAGEITGTIEFGAQVGGKPTRSVGVEVPPGIWHTVIANEPGSILFEVKAGPFDSSRAKEWAPWAPSEDGELGYAYLAALRNRLRLLRE